MAITPEVIAKVEECIPLGPLHNPPNLVGIRIAQKLFPGLLQVGGLRHRVPPDDAAGRLHVSRAARVAREARRPPLRLPRHEPPVRRARGAPPHGAAGGRPRDRHRPPRQRLLRHGGAQREERRHDDGADAARGADDGDPERFDRSGDHRPRRGRAGKPGQGDPRRRSTRSRVCSASRASRTTCGPSRRPPRAGHERARLGARPLLLRAGKDDRRASSSRSAGSTRSSSRAGSARTRRRSGR